MTDHTHDIDHMWDFLTETGDIVRAYERGESVPPELVPDIKAWERVKHHSEHHSEHHKGKSK